jgi:hypothetical protein
MLSALAHGPLTWDAPRAGGSFTLPLELPNGLLQAKGSIQSGPATAGGRRDASKVEGIGLLKALYGVTTRLDRSTRAM